MLQYSMTIGECVRRYGRPTLTTATLDDQIWECEDRFRYYDLMYKNLETRLERVPPAEFDELYSKMLDAERLRGSYSAELCILRMKRTYNAPDNTGGNGETGYNVE